MAESTALTFSHKELVEILIKSQDIHEGIWQLTLEYAFGTFGGHAPFPERIAPPGMPQIPQLINPSVFLGVAKIGIKKVAIEDNQSVNAAKVNPMKAE